MEDIRHHDLLTNKPNQNINGNTNGTIAPIDKSGILDPRLLLFGYTTETIQMLLVPMLQNK